MAQRKLTTADEIYAMALRLKATRLRLGLRAADVYGPLGIAQQQYSRYERGENALTVQAMHRIAAVMGVSPCELCGCCDERLRPTGILERVLAE